MLLSLPEELLVVTLDFLICDRLIVTGGVCRALRRLWKIPWMHTFKKKLAVNATILQMMAHAMEDRAGRFRNLHNSSFAAYMLDPYVKYNVQCLRPLSLMGTLPPVHDRPPRGKPPPGKRLRVTTNDVLQRPLKGWYVKL